MHPPQRRTLRKRRHARGQAMVEYSIINWVLIVGLVLAMSVKILPKGSPEKHLGKQNVIEMFLAAYQSYYNSFYFVLNLPFP